MRFVSDEVRDPIWKRVLALAMRIEYYEENVHSQEFRIDTKLTASTALARLCCWYRGLSRLPPSFSPLLRAQRLGLPYLYGYRSSVLNAFSNRLSEDPSLGLYLHSPFVDIPAETPGARSSPSNYLLCSWSCSTERSLEFAIVDLWSSVCTGLSWTWMECIPGFGENNWSSLIDNRDLKVLHPARPQSSSLFYHFTQFVHWTVALSRNLTATQLKSLPDSRVSTSL